jgi:hypothetical protein
MASQPPQEIPPEPTQPGHNDTPPPEVSPPTPDVDVPSPGETPPGTASPQA